MIRYLPRNSPQTDLGFVQDLCFRFFQGIDFFPPPNPPLGYDPPFIGSSAAFPSKSDVLLDPAQKKSLELLLCFLSWSLSDSQHPPQL